MSWVGRYINLERSTDRRAKIEERLISLGLSYKRFNAHGGCGGKLKPSEVGVWSSHLGVLKEFDGERPLHVIEDDIIFANDFITILDDLLPELSKYDLIFTETYIPPDPVFYAAYANWYRLPPVVLNLHQVEDLVSSIAGATSYLVNPLSVFKLYTVLSRGYRDGNPTVPFDHYLGHRARAGDLKVGCIFPFITSLDLGEMKTSTVREFTRTDLAQTIARYSFFVDADLDRCQEMVTGMIGRVDQRRSLLSSILRAVVEVYPS